MPVEPDEQQMADVFARAGSGGDGPVVMLNLNLYRPRAAYAGEVPGGLPSEVSGRTAYERYGVVALEVLTRVGGRVLWVADAPRTVIGSDAERYDEIIAVSYPSLAAFGALATDPAALDARPHRLAGLERATLLACSPDGAALAPSG